MSKQKTVIREDWTWIDATLEVAEHIPTGFRLAYRFGGFGETFGWELLDEDGDRVDFLPSRWIRWQEGFEWALRYVPDHKSYEDRVRAYEAQGCDRSDAQSIVDAEYQKMM